MAGYLSALVMITLGYLIYIIMISYTDNTRISRGEEPLQLHRQL